MSEVSAGEWLGGSWQVVWREMDHEHVVVPLARLVVVDPRVSDWRRAVDDAMEHVHQLDRVHLRLVP